MKNGISQIKTLIIDDSGLMRIMLSDALRDDPEIVIIGTATNGKDGVEKTISLNPDVVVTDMVMPDYDGLYVVKEIMNKNPKPILLLSSLNRTNTDVFEALNAGALDFVDKPVENGNNSFQRTVSNLLSKIKSVARSDADLVQTINPAKNEHLHTFNGEFLYDLVVMGSSTGGPATLEHIIGKIPENFPIPIIIAQHMPDRFIESFCSRLNKHFKMSIEIARDSARIEPGVIYLAPGTHNLKVEKSKSGAYYFSYTEEEFREFNNPSIDCLFHSVAKSCGSRAIATILTGMGKDGVDGMVAIRGSGGLTIAQDAESCIVNGMPGAARQAKAVDYSVKLNDISGFIVSCLS